ncbi:transcriptional regulator [Pelotomaculum propionicicum]|uniref:transcriptional regulator n=1 Tax=Pelotomaculum propionicicum TaxID=258475 RepID=UPI003B763AC5
MKPVFNNGGVCIFGFGLKNKTVKELRKNQGLTARELAQQAKVDTIDILRIDDVKVKDLSEPLKTKIMPILRGDYMDKIPW